MSMSARPDPGRTTCGGDSHAGSLSPLSRRCGNCASSPTNSPQGMPPAPWGVSCSCYFQLGAINSSCIAVFFFFRVHVPWVYVSFGFFFSSQVIRDCVTQPVVAFPFVLRAAVPVLFCALFFF